MLSNPRVDEGPVSCSGWRSSSSWAMIRSSGNTAHVFWTRNLGVGYPMWVHALLGIEGMGGLKDQEPLEEDAEGRR